ncbi:TIR domain-containing protein [Niallia nealsonii]|uniref:Nucleotide-binding-like protein n=1 Tax=Niallia nealsonii TaxID=115979 RepID=A0A2N0Z0D2_9BACI|nr:TIR domain-containing protein [Niallia nealsonii]PKG22961.1 nucleotide-binding-like protein [Niallia nealsonii]
MSERRPKVFIGSSREAIDYVNALQGHLSYHAEVTPWSAGAFQGMKYTMESLEMHLEQNDFAVFIFSNDDITKIREHTYHTTRDNTLFEMGLFWGRLKRERVFFIIPDTVAKEVNGEKVEGYHLLSDLVGLTALTYESSRGDGNHSSAVNTAAGEIIGIIKKLGRFEDAKLLLEEARMVQKIKRRSTIFTRKLSKALIKLNHKNIYDHLEASFRSAYLLPSSAYMEGVGIWRSDGTDGLKHVSGHIGQKDFYPFNINADKEEGDLERIHIIDCFQDKVEIMELNKDIGDKIYLICYPIREELVITVTIGNDSFLTEEEMISIFAGNHELIRIVDDIFGGVTV